ncbi:MAG: SIR2 family protein [Treponema sp.]
MIEKTYSKKDCHLVSIYLLVQGFLYLPDDDGVCLPTAKSLCAALLEKFNLDADIYGDDLETLSALVDQAELDTFLRQRFKINHKYFILNKIHLLSYITTNIDNIIHLIVKSDSRYYLRNLSYYGAAKNVSGQLEYIPLHGDVLNQETKLIFEKFDLAIADKVNSDLYHEAISKLRYKPVCFWGYSFHDPGVLKVVKKLLDDYQNNDIWIQCLLEDKKQITLFKQLGCNIILGNTEDLLTWIEMNIVDESIISSSDFDLNYNKLKKYFIPTINDVPAVPATDFYVEGKTNWYSTLAKHAIELDIVNDLYNAHIQHKHIILVGTDFAGKTTTLMQLSLKLNTPNKLFIEDLTEELSNYIINNINGRKVVIFVDNCEKDIIVYRNLTEIDNIYTIATATDYNFETTKHLLETSRIHIMPIKDLTQEQARRFYNAIDSSIKKSIFKYKDIESENFSILEMMLKNISNILIEAKVEKVLKRVLNSNEKAFEAVGLASYLSTNNSALSTDILFSYFDCESYDDTKKYVTEANGLLREMNVSVDPCDNDQDYYDIRSKLFLRYSRKILSKEATLKAPYVKVIKLFLKKYRNVRYFSIIYLGVRLLMQSYVMIYLIRKQKQYMKSYIIMKKIHILYSNGLFALHI